MYTMLITLLATSLCLFNTNGTQINTKHALETYQKAHAAQKNNDYHQAKQLFRQASQENPELGIAWLNYAQCLRILDGELQERLKATQKARSLLPENARAYYESALVACDNGQKEHCNAYLQKAISIRPSYYEARIAYGQQLEKAENWDAAYAHYNWVLQNKPFHSAALYGLALSANHLQKTQAEELALLKLISLTPNNPHPYLRIAQFYKRNNEPDKAKEYIEAAKRLEVQEIRPEMRPLPPSRR